MFFEENSKRLSAFVRLSKAAGARSDYVQGGGGNTSVKLDGGLMAIKASGFCLSDIEKDNAYAVLNCDAIRAFYYENEPQNLSDVEAEGSAATKANVKEIDGLPLLRPSVEAGFHSILKTYVLHTHSVYANLAACSTACKQLAGTAFQGAAYAWGWVPYTDPGANLTFAIRDELNRVRKQTGNEPAVILMQNHGIIVHNDDPDLCLAIHADANERLARLFGMDGTSFPAVQVNPLAGGYCLATTPYLKAQLRNCAYTQEYLLENPLYPDQMVFLADCFFMDKETVAPGQAVASTQTGELLMHMDEKKAKTLTETLTAVFFIMEHIKSAGYCLSTMGEAAKHFIANWESEKFRKSMAGRQK